MLTILQETQSSSSGTGVHHYMTRCPRQARLDKQFPTSGGKDARVGTLFHKLAELYYTGQLSSIAIPLSDTAGEDDALQEAVRLFTAYCQYFRKDEFSLIAAEKLYPETPEQAQVLGDLLVSPFTMRIDAIVEYSEEQAVAARERGLSVLPGRYLLDFKTAMKTDANAELWYSRDRQFIAYLAAYNALFPHEPAQGLIARRCIRHQDLNQVLPSGRLRSFQDYLIPLPAEVDVTATATFFRQQKEYLATDRVNLAACRDWGGCPHLLSSRCLQF